MVATERASVLSRTQLGPEVTPGTAVAATKRLGSTSFDIQPAGNINKFGPVGEKFDTLVAMGKEWSAISFNGEGSYADLSYLLAGVIRSVTPAQQGGSAAYLWSFQPRSAQQDIVQTYTLEKGEVSQGGRASRTKYGLLNSISMEWSRERVAVSGGGLAQLEEDDVALSTSATYTLTAGGSPPTAGTFTLTYSGQTTAAIAFDATPAAVQAALELLSTIGSGNVSVAATVATGTGKLDTAANVYTVTFKRALAAAAQTLTGTFTTLTASGTIAIAAGTVGAAPTLIAPVPILGNQIDIWMDTAYGSLGTTKLTRAFKGKFDYANRFGTIWPLNTAESSFAGHVELKPEASLSLSLMADDVGQALLTTMRDGSTKFFKIRMRGALIASTYYYETILNVAAKISDVIAHKDDEGIFQNDVMFTPINDADLGYPFLWTVQNTLTAL